MISIHSLKLKLILPLLIILILVFSASSLVIIERESNVAHTVLIERAKSFSSLSAVYVIDTYGLYYESGFFKFGEIIDNLLALNRDVVRIQILDVNGKILYDSIENELGKYDEELYGERYLDDPVLILRAGNSTSSMDVDEKNKLIDLIEPYFEEWGRHDYSIRYFVSLVRLEVTNQGMIATVFIYSAVFTLISFILIFFLINQFITSPIGKLIKTVRLISEGKLGEKVEINSKDEIGELAAAFNKMTVDLKISQDRLKDYSKDLEKQVENRTKQLNEKTRYLEKINKDLIVARKELNILNKDLEKRVKNRTQEVENLLKQKDEFINQLGHDLKTPLGPLFNLIPILEEKEPDKTKKEWLKVLHRNTDYMKNLVVKTIELAKLNSPKTQFSLDQINLNDELENIIENKKTLFEDKKINIVNKISDNYIVKADKLRLEELFTNIFENSVKFTKEKGTITLNVKEKNNFLEISITDTGEGMTSEQIDHIFDEFYKADESRHDFDSSGLGMSICKRIVERHGGKIWVKSQGIGKGTTVYFTIPLISKEIKET